MYIKGYFKNEEATKECFNLQGWLKTGDLCYIDDDGFLFTVDRLKELIKYKGYQVRHVFIVSCKLIRFTKQKFTCNYLTNVLWGCIIGTSS